MSNVKLRGFSEETIKYAMEDGFVREQLYNIGLGLTEADNELQKNKDNAFIRQLVERHIMDLQEQRINILSQYTDNITPVWHAEWTNDDYNEYIVLTDRDDPYYGEYINRIATIDEIREQGEDDNFKDTILLVKEGLYMWIDEDMSYRQVNEHGELL